MLASREKYLNNYYLIVNMSNITKDAAKIIVQTYKSKFLEPLLGSGEVANKLEAGLYELLTGENIEKNITIPVKEAFTRGPGYIRVETAIFNSDDIKTLGDLIKLTEEDLLRLRNVGPLTVKYIKRELKKYGLTLSES